MLYADSPIDSSLFGLYVHQNYPQFCDGVEHCEGVSEWLSWVDWNGGDDVCDFICSVVNFALLFVLFLVVPSQPTSFSPSYTWNASFTAVTCYEAFAEIFQAGMV